MWNSQTTPTTPSGPASNNETSVHEVDGFPKQFKGKELVDFILTKVSLFDATSEQANKSGDKWAPWSVNSKISTSTGQFPGQ